MSQVIAQDAAEDAKDTQALALSGWDRCDMCGAQAYIRVTLQSGELLFCAHHGSEYKPKLIEKSLTFEWYDETHRLIGSAAE